MSGVRVRRGRSAAYRPVWQWPLRTPARAAGAAVATVALVGGLTALGSIGSPATTSGVEPPDAATSSTSQQRARADVDSPQGNATTAAVATPEPTATTPSPPPEPAAEPTATDATDVAKIWVTAWLNTSSGTSAWLEALAPHTTEEYLGLLGSVDSTALPGGEITGTTSVISTTASSATVDVPTTALQLRLTLIDTGDGWLVANSDRSS